MNGQDLLTHATNVRYTKIKFSLCFPKDCKVPVSKTSAIRGGIGEMLLRANCIGDRICEMCQWENECIVQRTMYTRFEHKPAFVTTGESIGYVIECDNYNSFIKAGEELSFNLLLFGTNIVYFNQYLLAIAALGQQGLGKEQARFVITSIRNTGGEDILHGSDIYMGAYKVETIADYVNRRREELRNVDCGNVKLTFHTATTLKYKGNYLEEFVPEAIVSAVQRRLYILDCFEKNDDETFYRYNYQIPECVDQSVHPVGVRRYSNRREQAMYMRGIKGNLHLSGVDESTLRLLLAGELIHIGKNTSFGFGQYRVTLIE